MRLSQPRRAHASAGSRGSRRRVARRPLQRQRERQRERQRRRGHWRTAGNHLGSPRLASAISAALGSSRLLSAPLGSSGLLWASLGSSRLLSARLAVVVLGQRETPLPVLLGRRLAEDRACNLRRSRITSDDLRMPPPCRATRRERAIVCSGSLNLASSRVISGHLASSRVILAGVTRRERRLSAPSCRAPSRRRGCLPARARTASTGTRRRSFGTTGAA